MKEKSKNSIYFILLFFGLSTIAVAQKNDTFKGKFEEANVLMEDKYYPYALPIWLDLLTEQPNNANINSKIGMCYYYSPTHQVEGIPYFKKAITGIVTNYDPYMYTETGAKIETYFYYAHALHINYQLDSAMYYFNKFIELAGKKHFLQENATRQIEMCINAKKLIKSPDNVDIVNLGSKLNSKYSEHSPVLSLDESEIFFTSRRLRNDSTNINSKEESTGDYFEDVYVSYKDLNGEWSSPELLNFNRTTQHHATIALSSDNQTIYIYQEDEGDGNLYQSFLLGDSWSKPEKMTGNINSKYYETHLTISVDGKSLYFTSDRKGGFGGMDIYMSKKLPNGEWGLATNLGPTINTKYNEESPYFHPDGVTLYFSSEGHESMGGYDIFYTEKQEDGSWLAPTNIGYPINSTHDDLTYVSTPDGRRAYYASFGGSNNIGEKDIYVIEQKDAQEKALTLLKGHVHAPQGEDLPLNVMVYLTDNETGVRAGEAKPLQRTGSYVFIIPPGKNYNISYEADGSELYNENIYVPVGSEYNEINKEILLDAVNLKGEEILAETKVQEQKYTVSFKTLNNIPSTTTMQCVDDDGNIIFELKANEEGKFGFAELPSDQNYLFKFYDEDGKMVDCQGIEVELFKGEKSQAVYYPNPDCGFAQAKVGQISFVNLPSIPEDLIIQYLDDDGNVLYSEKVGKGGYFNYHTLDKDVKKLTVLGKSPCEESILKIVDESTKKIIFTELVRDKDCDFVPLSKDNSKTGKISFVNLPTIPQNMQIQYIDDSGKVIYTETVDEKGYFNYYSLNKELLSLKLVGDFPCDETKMQVVDKNTGKNIYLNFENTDDCNFVPIMTPNVAKPKFEEYFTYNKNTPQRNKELMAFIEEANKIYKSEGVLKISIESSASRVPTKTHDTNEKLTRLRAENIKNNLLEKLAAKGVNSDKIKFINITTLVQGPKYNGDYLDNKATYEKYQYVKVKIE